eukprot:4815759-Pyramimonas_sp.AAC.1
MGDAGRNERTEPTNRRALSTANPFYATSATKHPRQRMATGKNPWKAPPDAAATAGKYDGCPAR